MTPAINPPEELRRQGFAALVAALGWVNAVRFIQQYESGQGDYSHDRDQFLPDWDVETIVQKMKELEQAKKAGTV